MKNAALYDAMRERAREIMQEMTTATPERTREELIPRLNALNVEIHQLEMHDDLSQAEPWPSSSSTAPAVTTSAPMFPETQHPE